MKIKILTTYQESTQTFEFDKNIISIGKNMAADLFLNDKKISRKHAEIVFTNKQWFLKDLDSTNGTMVNGKKIKEIPLHIHDQIQMGDTFLSLHPLFKNSQDKITDELKQCLEDTPALFVPKEMLKERLSHHMENLLEKNNISFSDSHEKKSYIAQKLQEILGLGFLEDYLKDPRISEIMINGSKDIYIEKKGIIEKTSKVFESEQVLETLIHKILTPLGRHVDEASPMVDARLPDGSRINVILPPLSLKGPILTIRKFLHSFQTLKDLVHVGSISQETASFLETLIHERKNILISGGTSSGKTTLLNALSNCINPKERVITIEDSAELKLHHHPHTLSLEARPSNIEGQGEITIRRLVQNALRMRPDRIIIGECRGAETFDMLQAMNTGHEGCLTTCHANSPRDALKRLETMVLMTGFELPIKAIREHIASAIHIIIQTKRLTDGKRTVTHITKLSGFEGDTILTQDLFNSTKGDPHAI
ncbi:MAG: hypothetical protein A2Z91_05085 [Deltaproteobacteria bacterium GWA2_38_16]|nr:MAG: hypothetical protein A2Z91_05085 [Deltaproteobacteria bacterium GWA2_38_16]OGQ03154.1 MAG: hypothetical protein A3D19_03815 [Deltaproteobacteria bacterium RIFCSPHIGHO2_02_FULL_38_15]OGQ62471.1 MAG: hypothetical protein A3G92_07235 [Deltaproteobacteria bacterium RIFCSPLOWO2_12_FULL_38_8]